MSTALEEARIRVVVSAEELLKAVDQLPTDQLEKFVEQVLLLQARRRVPYVPQKEAELLLKIHEGLSDEMQQRYDDLSTKRRAKTLTPEEHQELRTLLDQVEQRNAERVEALVQLAQIRQISLDELMSNLDIHPAPYV